MAKTLFHAVGTPLIIYTLTYAETWKLLYVALVRPHLDYDVQVLNPFLQKNLDILEEIQSRATRVSVKSLIGLSRKGSHFLDLVP